MSEVSILAVLKVRVPLRHLTPERVEHVREQVGAAISILRIDATLPSDDERVIGDVIVDRLIPSTSTTDRPTPPAPSASSASGTTTRGG